MKDNIYAGHRMVLGKALANQLRSQLMVKMVFLYYYIYFQKQFLVPLVCSIISLVVIFSVPATFNESFGNQTVLIGDKATIECDVLGDNPIKVRWLRNHQFLDITLPPRMKVLLCNCIAIIRIREENDQNYIYIASRNKTFILLLVSDTGRSDKQWDDIKHDFTQKQTR